MTTKEFKKIKKAYNKEHKRWLGLYIGQFVYIEMPRFIDMEYYLCVITSIDVHERKVGIIDFSQNEKVDTISSFLTELELEQRGVIVQPPTNRELGVSLTYECP